MGAIGKGSASSKANYLVDLAILLAFLVAMEPRGTGVPVHEWLSLVFGAAIIVHLLLHWLWIAGVSRRLLGKVAWQARINYLLNVLFFIDMTLIIFTGVMISEAVLPALGLRAADSFLWRRLHSLTADAGIVILGLHLGLHARWIGNVSRRFFRRRSRGVIQSRATEEAIA